MAEFIKLSPEPTLAELAHAVQQVHACLDDHRNDSRARMEGLERTMRDNTQMLMQNQTVLMTALGVQARETGEARPVRTVATLTPFQLAWRIAAGMLPVLGLWQWGGKLWPVIWPTLHELNRVITGN